MDPGSRLKIWRENKQMTQQELAAAARLHVQYISDIERGKRKPGMRAATRIRDVTGGVISLDMWAPARRKAA